MEPPATQLNRFPASSPTLLPAFATATSAPGAIVQNHQGSNGFRAGGAPSAGPAKGCGDRLPAFGRCLRKSTLPPSIAGEPRRPPPREMPRDRRDRIRTAHIGEVLGLNQQKSALWPQVRAGRAVTVGPRFPAIVAKRPTAHSAAVKLHVPGKMQRPVRTHTRAPQSDPGPPGPASVLEPDRRHAGSPGLLAQIGSKSANGGRDP